MKVTVVENTVYFTQLNIYSGRNSHPLQLYIQGHLSEDSILEMEKYIESELRNGSGTYEAAIKFLKLNDILLIKNI